MINAWQGWQFRKQSFGDDIEVNVEEIRRFIDMDEECDAAAESYQSYSQTVPVIMTIRYSIFWLGVPCY